MGVYQLGANPNPPGEERWGEGRGSGVAGREEKERESERTRLEAWAGDPSFLTPLSHLSQKNNCDR